MKSQYPVGVKQSPRLVQLLALMLVVLVPTLGLCACGETPQDPPAASQPAEATPPAEPPAEVPSSGYSERAQATLSDLQAELDDSSALFAAAYLGDRTGEESTDLATWLQNNNPTLVAVLPFLLEIPAEDILGQDGGDLYCILPRSQGTDLTISPATWETLGNGANLSIGDPLYTGEAEHPVLLFIHYDTFRDETDHIIQATDTTDETRRIDWCPIQEEGHIDSPTDQTATPLILDFGQYDVIEG